MSLSILYFTFSTPYECDKNVLIDNLSYMNYYGEETYFTTGAYIHVVGTMFYYSKNTTDDEKNKILTCQQLIHSMIENLAYFSYTMKKTEDIIIGSKYMERFINAYHLFLLKNNIYIGENIKKLLLVLNTIKNKYRNRSDNEIIEQIQSDKEIVKDTIITKLINKAKDAKNVVKKLKNDIIMELNDYLLQIINCEPIDKINNFNNYIFILCTIIKSCINEKNTSITCNDNEFSIRELKLES